MGHDSLYRPLTITAPYAGPVGYRYDAVGNRTQTLYPTGEAVTCDYDDAGRLAGVSGWDSQEASYAYDDAGRVLWQRQPNAVQTDYGYDPAGRLVRVEHSDWHEWVAGYEYTLGPAGNRVAVTETTTALLAFHLPWLGQTGLSVPAGAGLERVTSPSALGEGEAITYSYDDADRLTGAGYASGDYYGYAYDRVGNRTVLTTTAGTTGYDYDDADWLVSVDGVACAYDNRGSLLSDGTWSYAYNGAGRLVRAETITATQVYTYNGDGLLVAQSMDGADTSFVWDQALAIPQVLATSDGVKTLYGLERLAVLQGGAWHYPQHDAIGSVRQWTDAAAAVLATQAYSPFGVPRATLAVAPWGFTGEWHDAGGLVYLRARWYNPAWGRFTQVDPSDLEANPYLYAHANPVTYVDRTGLFTEEEIVQHLTAHGVEDAAEVIYWWKTRDLAFWKVLVGDLHNVREELEAQYGDLLHGVSSVDLDLGVWGGDCVVEFRPGAGGTMELWSEGLDYGSLADYYFFDRKNPDAGHVVDIILARRGSALTTPLSSDRFVFLRGTGLFEEGIPSPPAPDRKDVVWGYVNMAAGLGGMALGVFGIASGICGLPAGGYRAIGAGIVGIVGGVNRYQTGSALKREYTRAGNLAAYLEHRLAPYSY